MPIPASIKLLSAGFALLALGACRLRETGGDQAFWPDLPVPRGFEAVEQPAEPVVVEAGTYRSGVLRFEGRGPEANVEHYYEERMPLFGWTWDADAGQWVKGPTRVTVDINPVQTGAYGRDPERVELLLRVRSQRPDRHG